MSSFSLMILLTILSGAFIQSITGDIYSYHPKGASPGGLGVSHVVLASLSFIRNSKSEVADFAVSLVLIQHNVG